MSAIRFFGYVGRRQQARIAVLLLVLFSTINSKEFAAAQTQTPPRSRLERKLEEQTQEQPGDIVRVRTDLVQTTVSVFDKRGKFVDNLGAHDFELIIDGQPHPVLFFERVINGVAERLSKTNESTGVSAPEDKTRTVMFFVDDFHLSSESITRTRNMLSHYIEQEMGESDEVVLASASGQLGLLQELTSEKEVLRAAVERLKYRPQDLLDSERPGMSAYQALSIERGDSDALTYFVSLLLKDELAALVRRQPQLAGEIAERRVRSRAARINRQTAFVATQTLAALNSTVRSSAQIPGRKLFIFISDGFFINNPNSDITGRLQLIADAAVRSGAVLYTVQASGLNTAFPDARNDEIGIPGGGSGRLFGEDRAVQDPLTQLATDTGGKALLNSNDLNGSVKSALRESNDYYLLAWRPDPAPTPGAQFHRIEVNVKGHPDLSARVQRGFFNDDKPTAVVAAKAEKRQSSGDFEVEDLAAAINGKLTARPLKTSVMANYLDVPNHGAQLSILMQVDWAGAESESGAKPEPVDIAGVVYNESGKLIGSFVNRLRPENFKSRHVTYLNQIEVKPGLYQVRGAARGSSGSTGRAMQWVKVPDLSSKSLALSSLLIGESELTHPAGSKEASQLQKAQLKIDKSFVRNSRLRFMTFIYNAARGETNQSPQLNARVDIFRGNKAVVSTPAFSIETKSVDDPARIPYAGEINLASLPSGKYRMRVTVIDLNARAYATQAILFTIE